MATTPSVFLAKPSQLLRGSSKLLFLGLVPLSFLLKLGLLEGPSQHGVGLSSWVGVSFFQLWSLCHHEHSCLGWACSYEGAVALGVVVVWQESELRVIKLQWARKIFGLFCVSFQRRARPLSYIPSKHIWADPKPECSGTTCSSHFPGAVPTSRLGLHLLSSRQPRARIWKADSWKTRTVQLHLGFSLRIEM